MKIRTRITVYVVLAGLVASLLLASWLIYELQKQPFQLLERALHEESEQAVHALSLELEKFPARNARPESIDDIGVAWDVWMEICDASDGKTLYKSRLARDVDLNSINTVGDDFESLSGIFRYFRRAQNGQAIFRVKIFEIPYGDRLFLVQIARSIDQLENLKEEIYAVVRTVAASLIFVTLVLIVIGHVVAGKILRPIKDIMSLAQSISDKNLTERVPVKDERDELAELSETLNRMLDRLQFSFARQKELLFDTSHELKTPLTTIRMAVEEMNAQSELVLQEEARDNLSRMESQVIRMERLVKDLLSLSALEALLNIERNPVRVDTLLSSLIDDYRFWACAEEIRIETEIQENLILFGDEEKLRRAFSNALDNAIKYNEEQDGERLIEVHAFGSPEELIVIVDNTGEALSDEESQRVFDQFHRVEKTKSPERGGSGLGLAIVKKTVELHRGDVFFESMMIGSRNINRLIFSFPSTLV